MDLLVKNGVLCDANGRLRADLIRCGIRMREHIKGTLEEVDTAVSPLEWVDPTR